MIIANRRRLASFFLFVLFVPLLVLYIIALHRFCMLLLLLLIDCRCSCVLVCCC